MTNYPEKFQKKPVVISAVQLDLHPDQILHTVYHIWENWGQGIFYIPRGVDHALRRSSEYDQATNHILDDAPAFAVIYTLEGQMRADAGDWIIQGVQKELYPCKSDIFEETYQKVEKNGN